jgi:hypothetical protein
MNRWSPNEPKHYSGEEKNSEKCFNGNASIEIE